MSLGLETKIDILEEKIEHVKGDVQKLAELQMKHEHQDEIRAVKQDQLMGHIQDLVGNLKNYQTEIHEMSLKNSEEIAKLDIDHTKTATRVKILYGVIAVVGGALLTGIFEWIPNLLHLLAKGK